MVERIVAAAIRVNGMAVSMPPPARHNTILKKLDETSRKLGNTSRASDQGFITSEGRYVDRREALAIARAAGHVKREGGQPELYSEDLW